MWKKLFLFTLLALLLLLLIGLAFLIFGSSFTLERRIFLVLACSLIALLVFAALITRQGDVSAFGPLCAAEIKAFYAVHAPHPSSQ